MLKIDKNYNCMIYSYLGLDSSTLKYYDCMFISAKNRRKFTMIDYSIVWQDLQFGFIHNIRYGKNY